MTQALNGYRPSTGAYLGAMFKEGFWATTTGQAGAWARVQQEDDGQRLTQEEWQSSPWMRPGLAWDEGMTAGRARAMAEVKDDNDYRRWVIERRNPGVGEMVLGIGAAMIGGLPAPENFVPIAGPAFRAAQAARLAKVGITAMEAATNRFGVIGGRAVIGAVDAAAGTAITAPFVNASRESFGDDVTFAETMIDIGVGAALGAGIGSIGGAIAKRRMGRAPVAEKESPPVLDHGAQQNAVDSTAKAGLDIADGKPVNMAEVPQARAAVEAAADAQGRLVGATDAKNYTLYAADAANPNASARAFWDDVASDKSAQKAALNFGPVDEQARALAAAHGVDINGYSHIIDAQHARKIMRDHGNATAEARRGQIAITPEDFARAPDIIRSADQVAVSETRGKLTALMYLKRADDGTTYLVEEVRSAREHLAVKSMSRWEAGKGPESLEGIGGRGDGASGLARLETTTKGPVKTDRTSAPVAGEYKGELAELEPAFIEPDYSLPADPVPEPARPLPKNAAEEHGIDPKTGDFDELADLKRLEAEGKLTDGQKAELAAAEDELKKTEKLADANKAAANCALGG